MPKFGLQILLTSLATLLTLQCYAVKETNLKNWKPQYVHVQSGCGPADGPQETLIISEHESECFKEGSKLSVHIVAKDRIELSQDSVFAIGFKFTSVMVCHPKKTCALVDLNGRVETQAPLPSGGPQQFGVPKVILFLKFDGEQAEHKFELKMKACERRVVCG